MKLQYIVTQIAGASIAGRWVYALEKGADGKRRIDLLPETAQDYVDRGWLLLDGSAPPATVTEAERAPEYDFRGSTVRDARPPINRYAVDHTLADPQTGSDKGALVLIESTSTVIVTLPKSWAEGDGCVIRRSGSGDVKWALEVGAISALPASRVSHIKIAERHSEIMVRVVKNVDGNSAVWSIEGWTSA
jgi:hypothetical protein